MSLQEQRVESRIECLDEQYYQASSPQTLVHVTLVLGRVSKIGKSQLDDPAAVIT